LPRHRGPDPTYWAIASGDDVTGVSVHRIEADYDTGDVLAQETLAIDPTWTSWNLARALDRPSLRLLRATVQRIKRGETIEAHVQDAARATAAPVPSDEDCAIRWSWPTARVLRHVRALAPAPGAWTELAGELVVITRAVVATNVPSALAPGETAVVDDLAVVRTADGGVTLLEAEIEGTPCDARGLASLVARHAR
jgi:methionyl-tRNA formyltransferase